MATPNELYDAIDLVMGGLVDPRELIEKMGPDSADVHVPQPLKVLRRKKKHEAKESKKTEAKEDLEKVHVPGKPLADKLARVRLTSSHVPGKALKNRLDSNKLFSKPALKPVGYQPGVALKARLSKQGLVLGGVSGKYVKAGNAVKNFIKDEKAVRGTKGAISRNKANYDAENYPLMESVSNGRKHIRKIKAAGAAGAGFAGGVAYTNRKQNNLPVEQVYKSMTWNADIQDIDEDKRQVFGFATVTHVDGEEVIDRQGDYIPLEEIEKAAYNYVLTSRVGGDMHSRDGEGPKHTADLIESVVFSPEKAEAMGIEDCPKYGWWIGMRVNDEDQWNMVKNGERTGISIHGRGKRVDK